MVRTIKQGKHDFPGELKLEVWEAGKHLFSANILPGLHTPVSWRFVKKHNPEGVKQAEAFVNAKIYGGGWALHDMFDSVIMSARSAWRKRRRFEEAYLVVDHNERRRTLYLSEREAEFLDGLHAEYHHNGQLHTNDEDMGTGGNQGVVTRRLRKLERMGLVCDIGPLEDRWDWGMPWRTRMFKMTERGLDVHRWCYLQRSEEHQGGHGYMKTTTELGNPCTGPGCGVEWCENRYKEDENGTTQTTTS
jgi:DNA-binding transcriptional ArsR family regulator